MDLDFTGKRIRFDKELNNLDRFVMNFVGVLDRLKIRYVLVSGYVVILFGRSRGSEDVDIFVERMGSKTFERLWKELDQDFDCIITDNSKEAFREYLMTGHAIRFAKKGGFVPNMEMKFPKTELDEWTIEKRKEVVMNDNKLFVSPMELQIPFKLFLGSEKDIEDAKYLYELFKDNLDNPLFEEFCRKLRIKESFEKYLKVNK
jgi:hypothetical protein